MPSMESLVALVGQPVDAPAASGCASMTALPLRSELAQRLRAFERRFRRAAIVTLVLWALAFALAVGVAVGTRDTRFTWIAGWTFGIALLLVFAGAFNLDRRRVQIAREVGIACGACGKPLLQLNAKLALTTGRCPECGALVISDP